MSIDYLLIFILVFSCYTYIRSRKTCNFTLIPTVILGLGYHICLAGFSGFLFWLLGLGVGMALLLPPFLLGGMGAGDIKLLGVVGSLKGAGFVLQSFIWAAILGGIFSLLVLIYRGLLKQTLLQIGQALKLFVCSSFKVWNFPRLPEGKQETGEKGISLASFPYGIAIALGVFSNYVVM